MDIKIYSSFPACQLAVPIIKAWTSKVEEQSGFVFSDLLLVLKDSSNNFHSKDLKQNGKTIIINITDTDIHPAHILSLSGQLRTFGQNANKPFYPTYLVEITVANAIAITVMLLLRNIQKTDTKQIKRDLSCIDCMEYFGVFNVLSAESGLIDRDHLRGQGVLDGGLPSYRFYRCQNNSVLAVGNIEYKFYLEMLEKLPLGKQQRQFCEANQMNKDAWPQIAQILTHIFLTDTAQNWQQKMRSQDTCITAVRNPSKNNPLFLHPFLIKPKL